MNALIVVTDLGRMKTYRLTKDDLQPGTSPAFEDVADVDLENLHSQVSGRVTDKAGRFAYGAGSIAVGERHSEEEQAEIDQLHAISESIQKTVSGETTDIYLAAPQPMIRQLLESLPAGLTQRIRKQLPLNLVKAPKLDLLKRFGLG